MRLYRGIYSIVKVRPLTYLFPTATAHPPTTTAHLDRCANSHCSDFTVRWSTYYDTWIALSRESRPAQ